MARVATLPHVENSVRGAAEQSEAGAQWVQFLFRMMTVLEVDGGDGY